MSKPRNADARHNALTSQWVTYEEAMASGRPDLTIRLRETSATAVIAHFLRAFRSRVDLASAATMMQQSGFADKVEMIRNHLFSGRLDAAASELSLLNPISPVEKGESYLEFSRLHFFRSEYEMAVSFAEKALSIPELSDVSRMSCLQIKGHCQLIKRRHEDAISTLSEALTMAELYADAESAHSVRAFLIVAYCEIGDRPQAEVHLAAFRKLVETIPNDELWISRLLTLIRTESHFSRHFLSSEIALRQVHEGRAIACWIGDRRCISKSDQDLKEFRSRVNDSQSFGIHQFDGWTYIPNREVILVHAPKTMTRLNNSPTSQRILSSLTSGPKSYEDLFIKVWNLRYDPERHAVHLRATLSKLRKLLPEQSLVVQDGMIKLR